MSETKPCTTMFSNGTEYEWFLENQCFQCTRFKKGHCRTYRMTEKARWDEKYFPYSDLMDYKQYGGKGCIRYTTERQTRTHTTKPIAGQIAMEVSGDAKTH